MTISAGEHPMWVAQQMGHTDWTMIARVYGRWMPTADEQAGTKAEGAFSSTHYGGECAKAPDSTIGFSQFSPCNGSTNS